MSPINKIEQETHESISFAVWTQARSNNNLNGCQIASNKLYMLPLYDKISSSPPLCSVLMPPERPEPAYLTKSPHGGRWTIVKLA